MSMHISTRVASGKRRTELEKKGKFKPVIEEKNQGTEAKKKNMDIHSRPSNPLRNVEQLNGWERNFRWASRGGQIYNEGFQ